MSEFDFAQLQADLESASRLALLQIAKAHPEETLCSFALYSDCGAMTACIASNTRSHQQRHQAENPDDQAYYKFSPAEWRFEGQGADQEIGQICTRLRERALDMDDDPGFGAFRDQLYQTCVQALENLRNQGVFSGFGEDFLLVFAVSDDDPDPAVELATLSRLNSPATVEEYKAWQATWAGQ